MPYQSNVHIKAAFTYFENKWMSSLRKKKFPATVKDIISTHIPKIYVLRGGKCWFLPDNIERKGLKIQTKPYWLSVISSSSHSRVKKYHVWLFLYGKWLQHKTDKHLIKTLSIFREIFDEHVPRAFWLSKTKFWTSDIKKDKNKQNKIKLKQPHPLQKKIS